MENENAIFQDLEVGKRRFSKWLEKFSILFGKILKYPRIDVI